MPLKVSPMQPAAHWSRAETRSGDGADSIAVARSPQARTRISSRITSTT